jgi:5-methylcytosine-specific restriction enzyme subunit McrC
MMAYAHLYKAPRLTLLYPHHAGLGDLEGICARFLVTGQETVLETASFDISNGKDLVDRVLNRILAGIQESVPVFQ